MPLLSNPSPRWRPAVRIAKKTRPDGRVKHSAIGGGWRNDLRAEQWLSRPARVKRSSHIALHNARVMAERRLRRDDARALPFLRKWSTRRSHEGERE